MSSAPAAPQQERAAGLVAPSPLATATRAPHRRPDPRHHGLLSVLGEAPTGYAADLTPWLAAAAVAGAAGAGASGVRALRRRVPVATAPVPPRLPGADGA